MDALEPGLSKLDAETTEGLQALGFQPRGSLADRHGSYMRSFLQQSNSSPVHYAAYSVTPSGERVALVFELASEKNHRSVRSESAPGYYKTERFRSGASYSRIRKRLERFLDLCGDSDFWACLDAELLTRHQVQSRSAASPTVILRRLDV